MLLKARKTGAAIDPYEQVRVLGLRRTPFAHHIECLQALGDAGFDALFSPVFSFTWTNHERLADILLHPEASVDHCDGNHSRVSVTLA